jgi:hypothetical protein
MCDTQVLVASDAVWFAKNSDREPTEPQPVVRRAAVRGDSAARLRASHVEIAQVPDRHATLLSQPAWCWGAEMGVNDAGVAIGNEAIFSRRRTLVPGLLGMDLVRLGLERAASAVAAVEVITDLLERHGQGGPAGDRDRGFHYDSSFIVADGREAWVLETAGRDWVARRITGAAAISNALTLRRDYDRCSAGLASARADFGCQEDTWLLPWFARAQQRRECSLQSLAGITRPGWTGFAASLRTHRHDSTDPRRGSNADLCMHAAGFVRRHQTTGSMIACLGPQRARVVFSGTSAPCLSIFRPVDFPGEWSVLTDETQGTAAPLWRRHERLHRSALADREFRDRLRCTRDAAEQRIFALLESGEPGAWARADRIASNWHAEIEGVLAGRSMPRLPRHWRRIARLDGIAAGGGAGDSAAGG